LCILVYTVGGGKNAIAWQLPNRKTKKRTPVTRDERFGNSVAELMDTLETVRKNSQSLPSGLLDKVHGRVEDLTILIQRAILIQKALD